MHMWQGAKGWVGLDLQVARKRGIPFAKKPRRIINWKLSDQNLN